MFITIIFSLMLHLSSTCKSKIDITNQDYFLVTSNSADCTTFDFIQCVHNYCIRSGVSIDSSVYCEEYQKVIYTQWDHCLTILCKMADNPQTYKTLQKCGQFSKNEASINYVVMGLAIGSGCAFIAIIISCYKWSKRCCKNQRSASAPRVSNHRQNDKKGQSIDVVFQTESLNNIKFTDEQICAICLDVKITSTLECNHSYHINCILDWARRHADCPQCRIKISRIILICKQCHKNYKVIELKDCKQMEDIIQFMCANCS